MTILKAKELGAALVAVGVAAGCGKGPSPAASSVSFGPQEVGCVNGPLRVTLDVGWSCFPATEKGKARGLGMIPVDSASPAALMVSEVYPIAEADLGLLSRRLAGERAEMARRIRASGGVIVERHGGATLYVVQGESRRTKGAIRREGYVVAGPWYARLVQVFPASGASAKRLKGEMDRAIGSLRADKP